MILQGKRYLIVTYWGYPFGGGEAFMYQSMKWATEECKMESLWLCFCGADNKPYPQFVSEKHDYGTIIRVTGGFSTENLKAWLKILNPHIVHHQGHRRMETMEICNALKICFVTGFHFWHGSLLLNEEHSNRNIIKYASFHKKDPDLDIVLEKAQGVYVASEFMVEAIQAVANIKIKDVIFPIPDKNKCSYAHYNPATSKYVTQINIHKHKGGDLFLQLCKMLPDIPFWAVRTELQSDELDSKIKTELATRPAGGMFIHRVEDVKSVYSETRVCLVPSHCDETFCRVALEAMQNGIPVVTTGRGNIKNIVGNSGFVLDFEENLLEVAPEWAQVISRLCTDDAFYAQKSQETRMQAEIFREEIVAREFKRVLSQSFSKSSYRKVCLMAPWCDQGLGIQCRAYRDLLEGLGFEIYIFSFLPYWNVKAKDRHQKNPLEWAHPPERIFYSDHTREEVKDDEIIEFFNKNNIGKAIIPETCWGRIFEVAHLLKSLGVKTFAVPNIEIVRRDEMHLHSYFYRILCNNYLCKRVFESYGFKNCSYLGYSLESPSSSSNFKRKPLEEGKPVTFVCLGGMNSFTRKQMIEVCQAFALVFVPGKMELTACVQGKWDARMDEFLNHPGITVKNEHLSYSRICQFYAEEHVNIQVSKHEGLGLGFYEALSYGVPCLTLDTAPHNEIVKDRENGWVIPCTFKPMLDNDCGLMESAYFQVKDLADKISEIVENKEHLRELHATLGQHFKKMHNINDYKNRWISCLNE